MNKFELLKKRNAGPPTKICKKCGKEFKPKRFNKSSDFCCPSHASRYARKLSKTSPQPVDL